MPGEEGWTVVLNLEGCEVGQAAVDDQQRQVRRTGVPQGPVAVCPPCGAVSAPIQQTRELAGGHELPWADRAVTLAVRVPQCWCRRCARALTPKLAEVAEGAPAPERVLARAAELRRWGDIPHTAAFLQGPAPAWERWYYAWSERHPRAAAQPITAWGMEEVALKKTTGSSSPCSLSRPPAEGSTCGSPARRRRW